MAITQLQIGQKTISFVPQCDYSNKTVISAPFTQQTRDNKSFFIATINTTEDCYLSFQGQQTDSENQFYIVDTTNTDDNSVLLSVHLDKEHISWDYYMQPIFVKRGKTIEFRVRGFVNVKIWKWGLI